MRGFNHFDSESRQELNVTTCRAHRARTIEYNSLPNKEIEMKIIYLR